jgi:hypothetical protein
MDCPKCHAPSVTLPWFTTRRRNPITCTGCGTRLERVLPAVPYYTLAFVIAVMTEIAVVPIGLFGLVGRWDWVLLIAVTILAINIAASAFLNARTRIEFADPADARQDKPGRWYPS